MFGKNKLMSNNEHDLYRKVISMPYNLEICNIFGVIKMVSIPSVARLEKSEK